MKKSSLNSTSTLQQQIALESAAAAYRSARSDGLCHDGAWECAVDALHAVLCDAPRQDVQLLTRLKIELQKFG